MTVCAAESITQGFVSSTARYLDCQARVLGSSAWDALALPGSTLSIVLSGFLTIFVALVGYNLILGGSLTVRSGTVAMVKIGAVLTLATSWPAYQALVYDLAVDGPSQILGDVGRPSGIAGPDGTLLDRLDSADAQLAQLAVYGVGVGIRDDIPPPPFSGFNAFALGGSRILFLITAIAGVGIVRLTMGLMLALGPFFIGFLLFESTRSLFEGWIRVLAGTALAMVGLSIALSFELMMINPWLASLLARRMAGEDLPSVPVELFVLTSSFGLIAVGMLVASARIVAGFRLALAWPSGLVRGISFQQERADAQLPTPPRSNNHSRASAVADSLASLQRRESSAHASRSPSHPAARSPSIISDSPSLDFDGSVGRAFSSRARARQTKIGEKRDQR